VDGGNSKTDVALIGADGRVLATARSGGFRPQSEGVSTAVDVTASAVDDIVRQLGLTAGASLAAHMSAYVAGADFPVEEAALAAAFAARGWTSSVTVGNDVLALLRAGVSGTWGVAVIVGAGVNCTGIGPDGRVSRFPALGRISGDWGGGQQLGEEALWHAARSEDGRGRPTALQTAVAAHFGMASVEEVTLGFHFGTLPEQRIHELAPLLFDVSESGDAVAGAVVDRMGDEVVAMAMVALRRLDLLATPTEVVLGGGVLRGRDRRLMARIEEGFRTAGVQAELVVVGAPPVVGAALLGLDELGYTTDSVQAAVRAAFATASQALAV
jgi:N-acetylglucosamine kinase-like BadF-type ATPase